MTRRPDQARARFGEPFEVAEGDVENDRALEHSLGGCSAVHISLQGEGDWDLERRGGHCGNFWTAASACAPSCDPATNPKTWAEGKGKLPVVVNAAASSVEAAKGGS